MVLSPLHNTQGWYMGGELIANHLEHISKKYIDNHLVEYCSNLFQMYFEVKQVGLIYKMRTTNFVYFPW